MRVRVVVAAAAVALSGCAPAQPPPSTPATTPAPAAAWQRVDLPEGVRPASLAVAGTDVLVGGQATGGPVPRLLRLTPGGTFRDFRLAPADPNAAAANLVGLTVAGDAVYAIGTMVAGAHSNPRPTVWEGSIEALRLESHTQEFFTFGGHDAGPLLGTVVVGGRPVVAGSRVGGHGPYGLLWTRSGHTWRAQPAVPLLASTPDRVLGFGGVATIGDQVVVTGDELGLAGGLRQQPVVFVGTTSGDWQQAVLPLPAEAPDGELSRASGVACAEDACWVTGWGRGHPLAWRVTVGAAGRPTPAAVAVLPGEPAAGNDPTALVALAGGRPLVLTNAASPTARLGCGDRWVALAAPPGRTVALVAAGDAAHAVADGALWRLAVPAC